MKEKDIYSLKFALQIAKINADFHKNSDDGGTSNMDTPTIHLPGWNKNEIEKAFEDTKLIPSIHGKTVFILRACEGQGYRRTAMAEAFVQSLKDQGYAAGVDYRLD